MSDPMNSRGRYMAGTKSTKRPLSVISIIIVASLVVLVVMIPVGATFKFAREISTLSKKVDRLEKIWNEEITSIREDVQHLRTNVDNTNQKVTNIETEIKGLREYLRANFEKILERLPDSQEGT